MDELNDFSFHNMAVLYRLNFSYKRINAIKDEASFKGIFKRAVKPKANSITIVFTSFPINSFHIS